MRLDQMEWEPLGKAGWWLAWTGNDYTRLEVWKRSDLPDDSPWTGMPPIGYSFGSYMIKAGGRVWQDLDPIAAQAVIYHLLGNPDNPER